VADTGKTLQHGGLSRGKATLIGVLAVMLVAVLYLQYGRSGEPSAAASRAMRTRPRPTSKRSPGTMVKKNQSDSGLPKAVAAAVDEARWKSPKIEDVVDYDPFALPAAFPKPRAMEPTNGSSQQLAAAAAADNAKKLAEAVAQLEMQLQELKQRGVQVIVRERDQYAAMIGDRLVHVGDEINGFTVTSIDPGSGVRVERKATQ